MFIFAALLMIVLLGCAVGFTYLSNLNPGEITVILGTDLSFTLPAILMVISLILIGLAIGVAVHMLSAMLNGMRGWRRGRKVKKVDEITTIYRTGVARLLSGDLHKGRTLLQKALDRDPRRIDSYLALASVAEQEGNFKEGIEILQRARKYELDNLEVTFKLAALLEKNGQFKDALTLYREMVNQDAKNRRAMRGLRDVCIEMGLWNDALEMQEGIFKVSTTGAKAGTEKRMLIQLRHEVARQQMENGELDPAIATCRDLVKKDAAFTPARVTLGDALLLIGRKEEAVKVFKEGYSALRKSVFLTRLEDIFIDAEDPAPLLAFYRKKIEEKKDDMLLKLHLGRLCLRLEMVDEAMQQLADLETTTLDASELHLLLAEALRRNNNVDAAVSEYQKALKVNNHLSTGFICDSCNTRYSEWHSRCSACSSWDTLNLPERQKIVAAGAEEV